MLEKATLLVGSYDVMLLVSIAAFGVAAVTVWSIAMKQRNSHKKEG